MKTNSKTPESRKEARERVAAWRNKNRLRAREHWRAKYWKKKGFPGYRGVALGGNDVSAELRQKYYTLCQTIDKWNHDYHIWNISSVSDAEYDRAFDELKKIETDHPELADPNSPTKRVGCAAVSTFAKVEHSVPMLSLEKATTAKAVSDFFGTNSCVVEPKVDGCSLAIRYVKGRLVQALTRGDGKEGEDVTHNARTIRTIPLRLPNSLTFEVRGEVFIKFSDFAKLNERLIASGEEPAANPRNSAAGALKLKDSTACARMPLSFMACRLVGRVQNCNTHEAVLDLLAEQGFSTTSTLPLPLKDCMTMFQPNIDPSDTAGLEQLIKNLDESRTRQDFPTDGLVFKINDLKVQDELGDGTTSPKWALAFKYPPEQVKTKITGIEYTVGKTGKVTPVANLEPVLVSGSVVARASLCNGDEIKRLQVDVGDTIWLEKSNEIIPKVMRVDKKASKTVAKMPEACPCCGAQLQVYPDMVDVFCINPACPGQVEARLRFATGKTALDIDGCGEQTVKLLVANGINTLTDLFKADDFPFLKPAARKKLLAGRELAKKAALYRKLVALNIEGWGVQTCLDVATRFQNMDAICDANATDSIEPLPNIGPVRASALRNYFKTWAEEIAQLAELGFWDVTKSDQIENAAIRGKTFCITGDLPGCSRPEAHEEIRKRGGLFRTSVSSKLSYLVVGEGGGKKFSEAQRWGVVCISPEEFFKMMDWFPEASVTDPDKEY